MTLEMFHDIQQNPKVPLIRHFLDICVLINIKTKTLVIKIFDRCIILQMNQICATRGVSTITKHSMANISTSLGVVHTNW